MITEDYVSFETAKLLKEKGFDGVCLIHYHYVKEFERYLKTDELIDPDFKKYYYPCATIQMAMRWLREVHGLYIDMEYLDFLEHGEVWGATVVNMKTFAETEIDGTESSYEKMAEVAIRYCLEHLI